MTNWHAIVAQIPGIYLHGINASESEMKGDEDEGRDILGEITLPEHQRGINTTNPSKGNDNSG